MGSSSRRFSFVGSGYAYEPTGGVELLENVRIPIWSTKCFTSRWFGPAVPLVESNLKPISNDRLSGTLTNRQSITLEDAILVFGKQVYLLDNLAPGSTTKVDLLSDRNRNLSGYLKSKQQSYAAAQPWNRDAHIDRTALMQAMMFHESESSVASEQTMENHPSQYLDLTGQLALKRPMLVARVKRPASRLVLNKVPSPPKIEELTLVRIILPLMKDSAQ